GISIPETIQFEDGTEIKIRVIDHRIGGRDWLSQPGEGDAAVPALVFWSLKGALDERLHLVFSQLNSLARTIMSL
ncbi:hypothetical protein, partial [Xanthomonas citri]|uniref:hypothetical protein n=1 Tax=Xanthomonas citri TaxID=346 RepID=UPI00095D7099